MSDYLHIRSITITTKEALSSLLSLSPSQGEFQASQLLPPALHMTLSYEPRPSAIRLR